MLDLIIRGGQVVTPWGVGDWDVCIQGDKIVAITAPNTMTDDVVRVIDATGKVVVPGGIEPHAHIDAPIMGPGNLRTAPPEQVSRAALFGGTTTLMDFAIHHPGNTIPEAMQERTNSWRGNSYADYAHHLMVLGEIPQRTLESLPEYIQGGWASVKIFTTNIRPPEMSGEPRKVGMGHLHDLMEVIQRHDGMLLVHSEDDDMVQYMYDKLQREERNEWWNMPLVHSNESEDVSFRRVLRVAEWTGSPVYFVHVSAREGINAIGEARNKGMAIYGETLHNYACFNANNYKEENGMKYHTYPSLKSPEDAAMLWKGIAWGGLPHHGHRRVLHQLGSQDRGQDGARRYRRPQRSRDPRGHHLQRRRIQAWNVTAAVCGCDVDQLRAHHGAVPAQRHPGAGQRRRHYPHRPVHQEASHHGRLPYQRLQHLGRL